MSKDTDKALTRSDLLRAIGSARRVAGERSTGTEVLDALVVAP